MKNLIKLFVVVLTAVLLLVSCGGIKKGGTIEVTNGLSTPTYVNIVKGADFLGALKEGDGTLIQRGYTEKFTFDEDGFYTVTAIPPITGFYKTVYLALDSIEKVTVK